MDECPVLESLLAAAGDELPEAQEAAMLRHVEECPICQAEFRRAALVVQVVGRGQPPSHALVAHCPDMDMAAFAMQGLRCPGAESIVQHLADCPECRRELAAVRAAIERIEDLGDEVPPPTGEGRDWWDRVLRVVARARRRVRPRAWERAGSHAGQEIRGPDRGLMVWVPAGEFTMGLTPEQMQYAVDVLGYSRPERAWRPPRRMRITRGFWLHRGPVTNRQYRRFCEATGRRFPTMSTEPDDHPVVDVSWFDALAYCEHYGLLLPTEAQWEYAARGPESPMFPWGEEWDVTKCCNRENRGPNGRTMSVDALPEGASWCGARHMVGNVWEFCLDWYTEDYYIIMPDTDPTGPAIGTAHAQRGGAWFHTPGHPHPVARGPVTPQQRTTYHGFRAVLIPQV